MLSLRPLAEADRLPADVRGLATVDPDIPLADQMMRAAAKAGLAQPEAVADFAIDEFDADALLDRLPRPMSTGELQLCALLITLSVPLPGLAVVDPTAGLDVPRRRAVVNLLRDLAEDRPVWVASDDPLFAG